MNLDPIDRSMLPGAEPQLNWLRVRGCKLKSKVILGSLILSAALCPLQWVQAFDLYSAEAEKSPPPMDPVSRQWLQQRNRQEQERFRKRVAIPGVTGPETQTAGSDRSLFAPEPPL